VVGEEEEISRTNDFYLYNTEGTERTKPILKIWQAKCGWHIYIFNS
jgi:hypothetical protein